jgi:putative FmdB family regulatory protein
MPIYEYVCEDCQTRHERIVMSNGSKVECPKCRSKRQTVQFSVFAAHNGGNGASTSSSSSPSMSSGGSCGCTPRTCGCH